MDITTLSLAKKYANKVAAGFSKVEVQGNNLIFTLNDGTKATMTIPTPEKGSDGISIVDVSIDIDGSLLCHMSDGSTINAGKITEYDLHSQELDNKIVSTRNELERVKNDVLETGTDTDTFVHLEDSAMAEYQELSIDGVCEQETTTGKNLLNIDLYSGTTHLGVTSVVNDKKIVSNGTAKSKYFDITLAPKQDIILKAGTAYTFSIKEPTSYKVTIATVDLDGKRADDFIINVNQRTGTKTYTKDVKLKQLFISQVTPETVIDNLIIEELQVEEGSIATSYEPYTGEQPSPSPDYPQPISTIENSLKITNCNKNFAYLKDGTYTKENDTAIINNNLITFNTSSSTGSDSYFSFGNGYTQTWAPSGDEIKNINDLKLTGDGGNYIATIYTNKTISGSILFRIYTSNNRKLFKNIGGYTTSTVNISLEDGEHIKDHGLWSSNTCIFNDYQMRVQLEKGTTATPYEQHLETQIQANLPEGEFIGKINDTYKDTLKVEYNETDGQYHLVLNKMIGKIVLDGSENWIADTYASTNYYRYSTKIPNLISPVSKGVQAMNTHFKQRINESHGDYEYLYVQSNEKFGVIYIQSQKWASVNELKTCLASNNVEVYYVITEPYTLDLGVIDMPITYNEITNLFTDSDLLPTINAKYYRNFISTVRNLQVNEKALKQELIDINARLSALETAQTSVASESEVVE